MLTYARQYRRQRNVRQRLRNFCIKNNGCLISREDRMLIKVLHQEKGSRKLLAEFPKKRLNWYQRCSLCWKLAFSVLVLKEKNITTQETQFIEILRTVLKWVLDYAVQVSLDCVIYCAFYSILFRGAVFSRTRCSILYAPIWSYEDYRHKTLWIQHLVFKSRYECGTVTK